MPAAAAYSSRGVSAFLSAYGTTSAHIRPAMSGGCPPAVAISTFRCTWLVEKTSTSAPSWLALNARTTS